MRAPIDRPNLLWRVFVLAGVATMGVLSLSDDAWQAWEDNVTDAVPQSAIRGLFAGTVGIHLVEAIAVRRMARRAGVDHVGAWTRTALIYGFPTVGGVKRAAA
jgi:hypothetical protein